MFVELPGGLVLPVSMRANRRYMVRAARYLAEERGIRQFLEYRHGYPDGRHA